ncbi:MAG: hypothetical protein U0V74_04335 [Chitinophagales bacterium]
MNDIKSNSERYNSQNISDRVKKAYSAIKQSKVVKVVTVAAVAVAGLFAIGGLLRVLAWVTTGWNQLTAALSTK